MGKKCFVAVTVFTTFQLFSAFPSSKNCEPFEIISGLTIFPCAENSTLHFRSNLDRNSLIEILNRSRPDILADWKSISQSGLNEKLQEYRKIVKNYKDQLQVIYFEEDFSKSKNPTDFRKVFPVTGKPTEFILSWTSTKAPFISKSTPSTIQPSFQFEDHCNITAGTVLFCGKCHDILDTSPCPEGQWLVLNASGSSECKNKLCPEDQVFYEGECRDVTSGGEYCGQFEIFFIDFQGNVYCDCESRNFRYDEGTDKCHAELQQGSCPYGEVLEFQPRGGLACVPYICKNESLIFNEKDSQCYNKKFLGKCPDEKLNLIVTFHNKDMSATCGPGMIILRNAYVLPAINDCGSSGSRRDHYGNCQTIFRSEYNQNPFSFQFPTAHVTRFNACLRGVLAPDGRCIEVNPAILGR